MDAPCPLWSTYAFFKQEHSGKTIARLPPGRWPVPPGCQHRAETRTSQFGTKGVPELRDLSAQPHSRSGGTAMRWIHGPRDPGGSVQEHVDHHRGPVRGVSQPRPIFTLFAAHSSGHSAGRQVSPSIRATRSGSGKSRARSRGVLESRLGRWLRAPWVNRRHTRSGLSCRTAAWRAVSPSAVGLFGSKWPLFSRKSSIWTLPPAVALYKGEGSPTRAGPTSPRCSLNHAVSAASPIGVRLN